ncbi:MAG: cation-translocating P-type ATPase [Clostridia bacterium]|nr:cation-translocating P-type ATPase [Clostridia bacterium]
MKEYLQSSKQVMNDLSTGENGLSSSEAQARLEKNGKNKLAEGKKQPWIVKFLKQFAEPMTIVLIIAAIISGVTEIIEHPGVPVDALIIVAVVLLNAFLGVIQESKAEKALEALEKIAAATSKVIRDGHQITIKSEDLVVGDIIVLEAGDAVPADARIIESASLKIEEAALTGESVPVDKKTAVLEAGANGDVPLGDRKNMVFMGSTVVYGRGKAVVTGTAMDTEMGKIADALTNAQEGKTPLQRKLGQLSKVLTILVLGICVVMLGVNFIRAGISGALSADPSHTIMNSFMLAISLAVAAIPEGLATVVTIVLSIGVTNMAKRNAIIRKLTAVETLGCTQIICSDKTGTLTQNKMTVVEHFGDDEQMLAISMSLCSDAEFDNEVGTAVGEPTECALVNYAESLHLSKNEKKLTYVRIGEVPFDSNRKMMTTVHNNGELIQFTKGAPDEIVKRCTRLYENGVITELTEEKREEILSANKNMADRALRVLAVGLKYLDAEPVEYSSENLENELCFVGLVGMIDPVRPEVKPAIDECRSAGIRPIMITGDHKDTAVAIAMQLGIIDSKEQAITGAELDAISDEGFETLVENYSVYARVQPEHKTRIVNAWRKKGKVTAMTGDGVNDAPSIKNADIGVGMGITGTDVTKNVADMILTDDNFATIVSAVGEGRRIYDNIRKAIQFLLASNLSEVVAIFIATLAGISLFQPVHLLFINLITDTLPAISLGMECSEKNIMNRKPRDSKEGIFAGGLGIGVVYQGILVAGLTLVSYFIGCNVLSGGPLVGTSMAFMTLSMAEIFHAFNMRSLKGSIFTVKKQNIVLWGAAILSFALTNLVLMVPAIATNVFSLIPLDVKQYFIALGIAFAVIPIVEIVKLITNCITKSKKK